MTWDVRLRIVTLAIDYALLAVLAWLAIAALSDAIRTLLEAGRRHAMAPPAVASLLALALLAAFVESLAFARLVDGRLLLLSGGNDMLTYETFGRDVATNGPLMLLGAPPGEARPFYFQPFYPYFLAATHLVFGEDYFGVFLLQRLGLWMSLIVMTSITRRLFGDVAAFGAAVSGGLFIVLKLLHWSSVQLSEMLFIPIICLCLHQLIALAKGAGFSTAIAAGTLGGLATLTRSSLGAAWLVLIPFIWLIRRRGGFETRVVHVAVMTLVVVISLAT
jgi:Dolichyl-phosphate-mannose-protein mannosyltransferase